MIHIDDLSKSYGRGARGVAALRDVTLSVEPGVWGVVGPNGAGKTTLLGLILGFLRPTSGSVTIDGAAPRRYLRRLGAGYLPERFRLPDDWPVHAALLSLARLDGHAGATARVRTRAVLGRLGLEDHADRPVGDLSRGLTQRVGIAQAFLSDHRLVILDEPTEGLDPLWRVELRSLIDELRDDDRTVLLASHELTEVERLTDRVIVLDDGRVTEVMDARPDTAGPLRFRIVLEPADPPRTPPVRTVFPGAVAEGSEGGGHETRPAVDRNSARSPGRWIVEVADAAELSHRLAALLDSGAIVHAVTPAIDDLEARVRNRLERS